MNSAYVERLPPTHKDSKRYIGTCKNERALVTNAKPHPQYFQILSTYGVLIAKGEKKGEKFPPPRADVPEASNPANSRKISSLL
jgi:hypothetical protein